MTAPAEGNDLAGQNGCGGKALPQLLTAQQVARVLVVSVTAVYELCTSGKLPYRRVGAHNGRIHIEQGDVEAYLSQTKVEAIDNTTVLSSKSRNRSAALRSVGASLLRAAGWKG